MYQVHINGIVQGVGFRPFIYRLASQRQIKGDVLNSSAGVRIRLDVREPALEEFIRAIYTNLPPVARIDQLTFSPIAPLLFDSFKIIKSEASSGTTLISPDLAICEDCQREMLDKTDQRAHYPFINCTNCGPRYSIIKNTPYDRPFTSMAEFPMCNYCHTEYDNPLNRRFHAQPVACADCGPHLSLLDANYQIINADPIRETQKLLRAGKIIGIKGIGGFHIAVDADNIDAVATLRARKNRPHKPFAIMCLPGYIDELVIADEADKEILARPAAPILVLRAKKPRPQIAPRNPKLGVFYPYAPLHYLLLNEDLPYLLMTSANSKDNPVAIHESELEGICDYYLTNNREIINRSDDSVIISTQPLLMARRSRGYVPAPTQLPLSCLPSLATGAMLKLNFCVASGTRGFLSPYLGNNEAGATFDFYMQMLSQYKKWFGIIPAAVFSDLQPDFRTTQYAQSLNIPHITVQHHHAHIAAVMADNMLNESVIGVALDGTGYGSDGAIWGGEIMICDYQSYKRKFHLEYMPLPGGDASIRHPLRLAWAWLASCGIKDKNISITALEEQVLTAQLKSGFRVFQTSSAGRLFDVVSALLGVCQAITYEAQAAIELEHFACISEATYQPVFDKDTISVRALLAEIHADINNQIDKHLIAAKFHNWLIKAISTAVQKLACQNKLKKIVLAGGVMQNMLILHGLIKNLSAAGLQVYLPQNVPINDGSISLGQLVVGNTVIKGG